MFLPVTTYSHKKYKEPRQEGGFTLVRVMLCKVFNENKKYFRKSLKYFCRTNKNILLQTNKIFIAAKWRHGLIWPSKHQLIIVTYRSLSANNL